MVTKEEKRLRAENEELKNEIRELKETLDAISAGEVDAIVVSKNDEKKVYTLENADQPYRVLVENIREGALTLSEEGMILYGNAAFASLRGLPLDTIPGTSLRNHIAPRDRSRFDELIRIAISEPVRAEMNICKGEGSFPVQLSMIGVDLEGHRRISALIVDRRKDYDRLLMQGRMLDSVADAVVAADMDGKVIYWNDAATKTYGWKRDEVLGRDLVSIAVPEISDEEARTILGTLMKGGSWTGEYMVKHRDGHSFAISARDTPVFDDDGRIIAILGASHDITERKNAERAIRLARKKAEEALEQLSEFYENSGIGFAFLDPKFRYEYINRKLADLNGLSVEAHLHHKMAEVQPERWERLREIFSQVIETGNPVTDMEISGESPQAPGITRYFLLNIFRVQVRGGNILGIGTVLHEITYRKGMELALRESENRFRSLAENAPSVLMRFDREMRIVYLSPQAAEITGIPVADFMGKTNREVGMPQDLCDLWESATTEVFETGEKRDVEFDIVAPSWKRSFYLRFAPERATDGSVKYVLGISTEITERKRMEEALRASEDRFRSVLENSQDIIYRVNARTGRYEYISPSCESVVGYTPDELMALDAETSHAMIHPDDRAAFLAAVARVEETGDGDIEYRQRTKSGEFRWLSNRMSLTPDHDGKSLYRTGNIRDITRGRLAEEALQESEVRFRLAVTATNDAIWDIDLATGTVQWNETYTQQYGRSLKSGDSWQWWIDHIYPADRDRVAGGLRSAIEQGESRWADEYRFQRADGEWAYVRDRAYIARDEEGAPWRVIGAMQDLTDRKKAEEELKQKHDALNAAYEEIAAAQEELKQNVEELTQRESQLQEALAEKEILLSEIHHRVKNNLSAFISLLSLEGGYEETSTGLALKKDLQNRARSMALIHETLYRTKNYSKVDLDEYLLPLIHQILHSYESDNAIRGVVDAKGVTVDLQQATPIGLIINELVTNSLKYAFPATFDSMKRRGEPCTIRVTIRKEDDAFILSVKDNGIGLPGTFDPLTTRTLGLKLVNFLAKHQLRAEIEVNAENGTEFRFLFRETP
jgi:PAS domain S-box-containing protein